jgi:hypothetical protein
MYKKQSSYNYYLDDREVLEERCHLLRERINSYSTEQRLAVAGAYNCSLTTNEKKLRLD